MKGFIGSANIDTNSRLCMSSAVAGHVRALRRGRRARRLRRSRPADLIVLVGSNTAWCHPVVYQRIMAARADARHEARRDRPAPHRDLRGGRPPPRPAAGQRRRADERPARLLPRRRAGRRGLPRRAASPCPRVSGKRSATAATCGRSPRTCDLPPADLRRFYDLFAAHPRTVTLFSQGINQSIRGTDQVNAIINVHLATGRIGKPGAAPFSITGQPNAMGGREVGGLASTLAAHMDFAPENVARRRRASGPRRAWPTRPGLKAVDLFRRVRDGRIKALWVMATNPAVCLPDAGMVREALASCPFVVVSDCIAETDTCALRPRQAARARLGREGRHGHQFRAPISRQRAFLPAPGEAQAGLVDRRRGRAPRWAGETPSPTTGPADIYREHARLSAYQNDGGRLFDLGAHVAHRPMRGYDAMEPVALGRHALRRRPLSDPRRQGAAGRGRAGAARRRRCANWPMTLNTGRYRDQWHTMTRTGLSPKLVAAPPRAAGRDPPARRRGARDRRAAIWSRVSTPQGDSVFRAALSAGQRRGEIFAPIHWTDRQSTGGRTGLLPRPLVDPHFGPAGLQVDPGADRAAARSTGAASSSRARSAGADRRRLCHPRPRRAGLAGRASRDMAIRRRWPRRCCPKASGRDGDAARGRLRVAVLDRGRLEAALYVTRNGSLPAARLADRAARAPASPRPRSSCSRAARPGRPPDRGPIVCVCFDVGMKHDRRRDRRARR